MPSKRLMRRRQQSELQRLQAQRLSFLTNNPCPVRSLEKSLSLEAQIHHDSCGNSWLASCGLKILLASVSFKQQLEE
jgi:hypothetical protein